MPTDYQLRENEDGSKTLLVNDVDQMYGTKGIAAFTLYPGKAYIEIRGQLYNRTSMPQTFLWWRTRRWRSTIIPSPSSRRMCIR